MMLPNPDDLPTQLAKGRPVPNVAADIGGDLRLPSFRKLVPPVGEPVAVPEVTIDKDRDLHLTEDEIWSARKFTNMALPSKPHLLEFLGEQQLGAGISAPDPRHDGTTLFN